MELPLSELELELNCLLDWVPDSELEWNCLYRNWNWNLIAKTELTPALMPMPMARPRLLSRRCLGIDHCYAIWLAFLFARIYGPCYDSPYDSDKASVWLRLSLSLKLRLWTSNSACDY